MFRRDELHKVNVRTSVKYLKDRELGMKQRLGYNDRLSKVYYTSLSQFKTNNYKSAGGVFGLEFSPDGAVLVASCERSSFILVDSLTRKTQKLIANAHSNCVNCIKFLDDQVFATGSDDNTVKIWDMRNLKLPSRTLRGHTNWVKNIDYSSKDNRLLTAAFDGGIYSWDLSNYTESNALFDCVFVMDGLMRAKLTPCETKLIIGSTFGCILIIHDINLETLQSDLRRFRPHIYRLMQESEQNIPAASCSNKLFSPYRKANRVELISDFPNAAEVISSLQIHPKGWCAVTRNITSDELSEWTCVHDIQDREVDEYLSAFIEVRKPEPPPDSMEPVTDLWMGFMSNYSVHSVRRMPNNSNPFRTTGIPTHNPQIRVLNSGILSADSNSNSGENSNSEDDPDERDRIVENLPRLTSFIEESIAGHGFIKELSFSKDGRVICSPYMSGIRLLAFDYSCRELSHSFPDLPPRELVAIAHYKNCHSDIVASCKFNPRHESLLVSGCLGGQIVWYQPVL